MNKTKNLKRNAVILCLVQVICVLGFHVVVKIISFLLKQPYIISEPYIVYISPPLIAAIASLMLCTIFPIKTDLINAVRLSIPATIIYFIYYIILPYVIGGFNSAVEALPFLCIVLIPLTIGALLVNGFAIWLGSLMHSKLYKPADRSD